MTTAYVYNFNYLIKIIELKYAKYENENYITNILKQCIMHC